MSGIWEASVARGGTASNRTSWATTSSVQNFVGDCKKVDEACLRRRGSIASPLSEGLRGGY